MTKSDKEMSTVATYLAKWFQVDITEKALEEALEYANLYVMYDREGRDGQE